MELSISVLHVFKRKSERTLQNRHIPKEMTSKGSIISVLNHKALIGIEFTAFVLLLE